jgi:hypothetical protein
MQEMEWKMLLLNKTAMKCAENGVGDVIIDWQGNKRLNE